MYGDADGDGIPDIFEVPNLDMSLGDRVGDSGGQTTWDAVVLGFMHSGASAQVSYPASTGHHEAEAPTTVSGDVPAVGTGAVIGQKTECNPDERTRIYGAYVGAHSSIDIVTLFEASALRRGVIRIDTTRSNTNSFEETKQELADANDPWHPPYDLAKYPPAGYLRGFRGLTKFVMRTYQIGKREGTWPFGNSELVYDKVAMVHLELSLVNWYFFDVTYYTSLLILKVIALPIWDPFRSCWSYKIKPFENHCNVAKALRNEMLAALKAAKPTSGATLLRESWVMRHQL